MKAISRIAQRFGLGRAIGVLLLTAFLALRFWNPQPLEELRLRSFDFYQLLKPREAVFKPVVIVDIDEASLAKFGQWPWPRTLVAKLVDRLTDLGSAAIGFDVVFAEPDRTSPALIANEHPELDDATREKLSTLPSNDEIFAKAISRSRVVLGQSGEGIPQPDAPPVNLIGFAVHGARGMSAADLDPTRYVDQYPALIGNIPILDKAATGHGLFSFRPDHDGIVRRAPLAMSVVGRMAPALSTELVRVGLGKSSPVINLDQGGVVSVGVPGFDLPTDGNGRVWVYFSKHDASRYVSAKDVLEGNVSKDRFDQRLVLIGTSAIGLLDLKTTPLEPAMPGVEVHAQVLEAALAKMLVPPTDPKFRPVTFLSNPPWAHLLEMTVAFFVGIAIIVLAPMVSALTLLIIGGLGIGAMMTASWLLFAQQGLLLDATFPLMSSLAVYAALVFVNYFREQFDRKYIHTTFGQYLSPVMIEQMAQSRQMPELGGEERTMTFLFSDVRGFTAISELYKHDPHGLTHLMNSLLTPLSDAIQEHRGTIDKYMGDAIMAFWNHPLDDAQHEIHACEAAIDMLERLDALNRTREEEAKASGQKFLPIKIGVGVNTGRCVVGNMGSTQRFQYTVLGDAVNLASRLEGQTKSYGAPILVGSKTAEALKDHFELLELDCITVKGKTEPEVVYTVLGRKQAAPSVEVQAAHQAVTSLLTRYRAQDWTGALQALTECRATNGVFQFEDFADLYQERIEMFQQNPPGPGWNGVFALTTK